MSEEKLLTMTRDELLTAVEAIYGPSEGEERLSYKVIKSTRKPQECMCPACGPHPIPVGSAALRESAKTGSGFGSCYTCEPCTRRGLAFSRDGEQLRCSDFE